MEFSVEQLRHIAHLAALEVSDDEVASLKKDLENILDFVAQLSSVDTQGVPATSHVHGEVNAFREDQIQESLPAEKAVANAPDPFKNQFRVPRVI